MKKLVSSLLVFIFPVLYLFGQSQQDYYDRYDYNLRRYKGVPLGSDKYPIYNVPPKFEKNPLVSPHNAQLPFENQMSIPALPGKSQGANAPGPEKNTSTSIVNPYTGEVNYAALQKQSQQKSQKPKLNELEAKKETYKETPLRRFSIIFAITLPFGAAVGVGFANLAGIPHVFAGSILIGATAAAISYANAELDRQEELKFDKKKHTDQTEKYLEKEPVDPMVADLESGPSILPESTFY